MSIGFWQIAIVVVLVVLLFGRGKILAKHYSESNIIDSATSARGESCIINL